MGRGGKRQGAGRKKTERPTNSNVAQKVLAQARVEQTWLALIDLEKRRLGIGKDGELLTGKPAADAGAYRGNFSTIPLTNLLRYLEDRAYGRPASRDEDDGSKMPPVVKVLIEHIGARAKN